VQYTYQLSESYILILLSAVISETKCYCSFVLDDEIDLGRYTLTFKAVLDETQRGEASISLLITDGKSSVKPYQDGVSGTYTDLNYYPD